MAGFRDVLIHAYVGIDLDEVWGNEQVSAIVQKIRSNILQSRTLATTRDALLPKLLSGEIRVSSNEQRINE